MKPQRVLMLLGGIFLFVIAQTIGMALPLVGLVAVVAAFVAWAAYLAKSCKETKRALERIAQRFDGRFEQEGGHVKVPLHVENYPALLAQVPRNEDTAMVFSVSWPDSSFRCEVFPDIMSGFHQLLGMQDIEIGSPEFDRSYIIKGNDEARVRAVLTAEAQYAIIRLTEITANFLGPTLHVRWMGGTLEISTKRWRWSYELLERFVLLSAQLLTASLAPRGGGVEFTGEMRRPEEVKTQCQVCGEPLVGDLVSCPSCGTPHHRECWEYFGGCSTYACGQKKHGTSGGRRTKVS